MVRQKGPDVALGLGLDEKPAQAADEGFAVLIVEEDLPALDPSRDYVLQEAGQVETGLFGHDPEDYVVLV